MHFPTKTFNEIITSSIEGFVFKNLFGTGSNQGDALVLTLPQENPSAHMLANPTQRPLELAAHR